MPVQPDRPALFLAAPATRSAAEWLAQAQLAREQGDLLAGLAAALAAQQAASAPQQGVEAGFLACFFHDRLGNLGALIALGEPLLAQWRAGPGPAGRLDLLRWVALASAETGRFDLGLALAGEACGLADTSGDAVQQAIALGLMAACFERMGDPWQAERLMLDALVHAERHGAVHHRAVTLNNLAVVMIGAYHLLRGVAPDEAAAVLGRADGHARRAHAMRPLYPDPYFQVHAIGNLAEVLMHQGALAEAERALHEALAQADAPGHAALAWRIRCSMAEALLLRDQPQQARSLLAALAADGARPCPKPPWCACTTCSTRPAAGWG